MSVFWLRVAALLYVPGLVHAMIVLLGRRSQLFPYALGSFCVATVLHGVSLVETAVQLNSLPVNNFHESMAVVAFLSAVAFLFVHWRYRFAPASVLLFPLVFVMAMVAATEAPIAPWSNKGIRNAWLAAHVILVLGGYAALLVSTVASGFYLLQEKHLKRKTAVPYLDRLPPLGTLDELITRSLTGGFVLVTASVIAVCVWAYVENGAQWVSSGPIGVLFFTWGIYLLVVYLRTGLGWRGRRAAMMVMGVLCCSALAWAVHAGLQPVVPR